MNTRGTLEWGLKFGGTKDELARDIVVDPTDQGVVVAMTCVGLVGWRLVCC